MRSIFIGGNILALSGYYMEVNFDETMFSRFAGPRP